MASSASGEAPPPKPDFSGFERANESGVVALSLPSMINLAATSLGTISHATLPQNVPWYVIDAMGFDPYVDLGEHIWKSPLQDATIYRVEHADPSIRAETEAWFEQRRIKKPLLRIITSAFAYGAIPYVFDWGVKDLAFVVARDGAAPFTRSMPEHVHYSNVHDLHPGEVTLEVKGDELLEIVHVRNVFRRETGRPFIAVWGQRFGSFAGNSSRRKAYSAWYEGSHLKVWKGRYLERSVDPPRIGYAPAGTVNINGNDIPAAKILRAAIMALKGGGTAVLPGGFEGDSTERAWAIDAMDLPDRSKVWHEALDSTSVDKLVASMVPPSAAGITDSALASGRVHVELLQEVLNIASNWVAEQLDAVIECVHRFNYGDAIPPPTIVAREFPRAKAKKLLEIFKQVAGTSRQVAGGKEVTLAERVDASLLEDLGVKMRPLEEAAREKRGPQPGTPGRPQEPTGDRDDRRDNAREPEGEDAVGAEGEGAGE